jgi:hypothetical protein
MPIATGFKPGPDNLPESGNSPSIMIALGHLFGVG